MFRCGMLSVHDNISFETVPGAFFGPRLVGMNEAKGGDKERNADLNDSLKNIPANPPGLVWSGWVSMLQLKKFDSYIS